MKVKINEDKPYSGKQIKFQNRKYELVPEQCLRGCQGCCFYNRVGCEDILTKNCREGFIFKEAK